MVPAQGLAEVMASRFSGSTWSDRRLVVGSWPGDPGQVDGPRTPDPWMASGSPATDHGSTIVM
jgi:hypothetical protein